MSWRFFAELLPVNVITTICCRGLTCHYMTWIISMTSSNPIVVKNSLISVRLDQTYCSLREKGSRFSILFKICWVEIVDMLSGSQSAFNV